MVQIISTHCIKVLWTWTTSRVLFHSSLSLCSHFVRTVCKPRANKPLLQPMFYIPSAVSMKAVFVKYMTTTVKVYWCDFTLDCFHCQIQTLNSGDEVQH